MFDLFVILLSFFHLVLIILSTEPPYVPKDDIILDCGAAVDSVGVDGRLWMADKDSKFGPVEASSHSKSSAYMANTQASTVEAVPYLTARISRSQFKYVFPVNAGQKFVRLYLYPTSYRDFDGVKAFLSVKAGSYTLLKNFSAFFTAQAFSIEAVVREFCLTVDQNQDLELTFTPFPSASHDSYAFINAIEIKSMPPYLYYTPPDQSSVGIPLIGQRSVYFYIDKYTALETVYRLNVGGRSIPPIGDTGMYRLWSDDFDYILSDGQVYRYTSLVPLKYSRETPPYTAPEEVYRTARIMNPNATHNMSHNLSWGLPVDSGFRYLVRLHFCYFDNLKATGGHIYINNQIAGAIQYFRGGNAVPFYVDYMVRIEMKSVENRPLITIALEPDKDTGNVSLNGIEVFKVSNASDNLAGPNWFPKTNHGQGVQIAEETRRKAKWVIPACGGIVGLFIMVSLICYMFIWRHKRPSWFCSGVEAYRGNSCLPEELCRHFSLDEIKAATSNFHHDLIIGKGGFGKVYKGFLDNGEKIVAIKRLNPESRQGAIEFFNEIGMLSQLRHIHLVSLIGYCHEKPEMILVYDYMINGTLSDHLYGNTSYDPLTWKQRLEICKGAATGLNYLHAEVKHTVIHRDIKTSNILLDDKLTAKVSDFGLSKMDPKLDLLNTAVKGTWGYLDPEYARGHSLTEKSDVYSFGVMLFEVLFARKVLDKKLPEDEVNLARWAKKCIAQGTLYQVIDPHIKGKISPECFKVFVEIAESSIQEKGVNRPSMNDVMEKLGFALELQQAGDAEKDEINPGGEHCYPEALFPMACDNIDADNASELSSSICSRAGTTDSKMTYPSLDSRTIN